MTSSKRRSHARDLRGASRLVVDATTRVTGVVQAMHGTIGGAPARLFSWPVYASIRGIAKLVGKSLDVALAQLEPLLGASEPGPERDAIVAALNGVLGDYLEETENPLAIRMQLRTHGEPRSRIVVLVHGSSMNDRQWLREGHDHAEALARDLDATAVYVLYNSGRHVSQNGRELAAALEALLATWPTPVESVALVGHSMGGLVARSALRYAEESTHAWRAHVQKLVCLGTPHHGAPLERIGNLAHALAGVSRYSAPIARLGRLRSAGVTDLRFGNVLDEDWAGRDRFAHSADPRRALALPSGVACYALAGTTATSERAGRKLPGDGVVPVDSALGRHALAERELAFPESRCAIAFATGHLDLVGPRVYETLLGWLRS
ncbi:MAG TPA: alpha/beta fold hydrolase [Polyangiaceae bacterium]